MRIVYRGNFGVSFSTESHVAASLEELGHTVVRHQENEVCWQDTERDAKASDMLLWTQTRGYALNWPEADAFSALHQLRLTGVPTVGFHLDLWHGLERQTAVAEHAFFRVEHLFTADGDHDAEWAGAGVNHHWLPPAVYGAECVPGTPRQEYRCDVAFVGSWRHYGHAEWWPQRKALLDWLRTYPAHVELWPKGPAIRGQALNDLYASAKVVVGDSALWTTSTRYMSDRLFESVGRGAFTVFPRIQAATEMLTDGVHCRYYSDLQQLRGLLDFYLNPAHAPEREMIRAAGQAHVRENHTYRNRMETLLATVGLTAPASR